MVKNNKCIINIPVSTPDISLDYIKFLALKDIACYGMIHLGDLKDICSDIIGITIEKKFSDFLYYYSSPKDIKYITISVNACSGEQTDNHYISYESYCNATKSIIFDNLILAD